MILCLFDMKLGTQHYVVYIVLLKLFEFKTVVICLKLRAKLCFKGFLRFLDTFSLKEVQTLFVRDDTSNTTLFGIYYIVEIVRIYNSHMLVITCLIAF